MCPHSLRPQTMLVLCLHPRKPKIPWLAELEWSAFVFPTRACTAPTLPAVPVAACLLVHTIPMALVLPHFLLNM